MHAHHSTLTPKTRKRRSPRSSVDTYLAAVNALFGWHQHPRNGKIARLPESIRDYINHRLDDGVRYRDIIAKLQQLQPPLPYAISEMNLSNWYHGGYQDWRRKQEEDPVLTSPTQNHARDLTTAPGVSEPPGPGQPLTSFSTEKLKVTSGSPRRSSERRRGFYKSLRAYFQLVESECAAELIKSNQGY